jgi:predicted nucleic acid-binding protein
VIAVDSNILVYAHREDSSFHEAAYRRLAELAQGAARDFSRFSGIAIVNPLLAAQ